MEVSFVMILENLPRNNGTALYIVDVEYAENGAARDTVTKTDSK